MATSILETLIVRFLGDDSHLKRTMRNLGAPVDRATRGIDRAFSRVSARVDAVGTRMQRNFQVKVARAAQSAVRTARSLSTQIGSIATQAGRRNFQSFVENALGLGAPANMNRLRRRAAFLAQIAYGRGQYGISQIMNRRARAYGAMENWNGVVGPRGGRPANVRSAQTTLRNTAQWMVAWRGTMGNTMSGFGMLQGAAIAFGNTVRLRTTSAIQSLGNSLTRVVPAIRSFWNNLTPRNAGRVLGTGLSALSSMGGRISSSMSGFFANRRAQLQRAATMAAQRAQFSAFSRYMPQQQTGSRGILGGLGRGIGAAGRGIGMGLGAAIVGGVRAANLGTSLVGLVARPFQFAMGAAWQATNAFSMRFGRAMRRIGYDASYLGRKLTFYISAPLMAIATLSVSEFAKFDDALTTSMALLDKIGPGTRKSMESTAFGISKDSRTDPTSLARGYAFLASAGYDAAQSMANLGVVEKFAVAGAFDVSQNGLSASNSMYAMSQATNYLIDTQTALGERFADVTKNQKSMIHISDVLTKANQIANGTVEDFAQALTNKGAAALRLVNKSLEEGTAVLAAYAAQGVKGQTAGEKLYILIRDTQRAALKNKEAWSVLRLSVFDAAGNMRPLADILEGLEKRFAGMSDAEKRTTFMMLGFQDRSLAATMQLFGMSGAIREYQKALEHADGATEKVANVRLSSFMSQIMMTTNRIRILAIQIGEFFLPYMLKINEAVQRAIDWWSQLSKMAQKWTVFIGLALAAIGPLMVVVGVLALSFATLLSGAAVLKGLFLTLAPFAAVVITISAAVIGLTYALVGKNGLLGAWDYVIGGIKKFAIMGMGFLENFTANMKIMVDWIQANWTQVFDNMVDISGHNFSIAFETFMRMASFTFGWFTGQMTKVFSLRFVGAVSLGLHKSMDKFLEWSGMVGLLVKSALSGGKALTPEQLFKVANFQVQLYKDVMTGFGSDELMPDLQKIFMEGLAKMKSPVEGIGLPKFITDLPADVKEEVDATVKPVIKLANTLGELHDELDEPFVADFRSVGADGIDAVVRGSQEHLARVIAFMRGLPADVHAAPGSAGAVGGGAGKRTFAFIQAQRNRTRLIQRGIIGTSVKSKAELNWESLNRMAPGIAGPSFKHWQNLGAEAAAAGGGAAMVKADEKIIKSINSASPERAPLLNVEDYLAELVSQTKIGNDLERKRPVIKLEPANIGG